MKCFVKFGKRKHLEEALHKGKLFMNTFAYFRKCEGMSQDKNDGMDRLLTGKRTTVVFFPQGGNSFPMKGLISVGDASGDSLRKNIYCMHALQDGDNFLHAENYKRGDSALIIYRPDDFIKELKEVKKEVHDASVEWQLVEYIDGNTYHGDMGPFRKYKKSSQGYSYQDEKEFRIVLSPGYGEPACMQLSKSLVGMAAIKPVHEVKEFLESL